MADKFGRVLVGFPLVAVAAVSGVYGAFAYLGDKVYGAATHG